MSMRLEGCKFNVYYSVLTVYETVEGLSESFATYLKITQIKCF